MIEKTDKLIITTVVAQRRGLAVPLDVLETVYGKDLGLGALNGCELTAPQTLSGVTDGSSAMIDLRQ